jgi:hypothetical protein
MSENNSKFFVYIIITATVAAAYIGYYRIVIRSIGVGYTLVA